MNLSFRGVGLEKLQTGDFWRSWFGSTLATKLILVATIVAVSGFHNFFVGQRASAILANPASPETLWLRRQVIRLGSLNLLSALVVLGILLVRGVPW